MRKEVKTGLYAVIVIAVTLIAVEFLKGKDIFSRTDTYYIICRPHIRHRIQQGILFNDLDSLVRSIRNDPKKYIKISVF